MILIAQMGDFNARTLEIENKIPNVFDFVKNTRFDIKLNKISNRITSGTTKAVKVEIKLDEHETSCTN